jgi:dihydrofolate synthase/folylpolyglutamate synthase
MSVTSCTLGGTTFSYKGKEYSMGLCGKFQLSNAEVALETIDMLIRRGFSITYEDIKKGFASIRLKSKFEILSLNPIIIADSTHKAVAISTVCDSLLDFKSLTGNKICLCLPEGQIIGEYISSLEERGYNIQKIFTTATHPEDPLIFPCPTPKAMAKEALSFTTSDMILLISGQYDFTDKLRREILAKLNF